MASTVVARPRATLIMTLALALVLLVAGIWCWVALGADVRARVTWYQLATLVFFLACGIGVLLIMARAFVRADATGLTYRNFLATRRLSWAQVDRLRFTDGDPFAYAYLATPAPGGRERVQLMGIQQTDGERGRRLFSALSAIEADARAGAEPHPLDAARSD